jgi:hypothetical protein
MAWGRDYPVVDDVPDADWSATARRILTPPYIGQRVNVVE